MQYSYFTSAVVSQQSQCEHSEAAMSWTHDEQIVWIDSACESIATMQYCNHMLYGVTF